MPRFFDATAEEMRQIRSPIIQAIAGGDDPVKQKQREKVCSFMLSHLDGLSTVRTFSFPSLSWAWERMMRRYLPVPTYHIGIERNWHILANSIHRMPERPGRRFHFEICRGWLHGFSSRYAAALWADARSWFGLRRNEVGRRGKAATRVRDKLKRWHCAWLDFHGPIDQGMSYVLSRLGNHGCQNAERLPVVVTLQDGREKEPERTAVRMFGGREKYLRQCLAMNRFRCVESLQVDRYTSDTGTAMMQVYAVLRRRVKSS